MRHKGDGVSGFGPGDVFREFTYVPVNGVFFYESNPDGPHAGERDLLQPRALDLDLQGATRAEMCVEFWGGHIGTSDQKFAANDNDWIPLPQPQNTPTPPECYFRNIMGNPPVPIPLDHLKHGRNVFRFTCGPQMKYSFDDGHYWVYAFTVRVHYDPAARPHPTGRIADPAPGSTIGESPLFSTEFESAGAPVTRVEFVGNYEDFNWSGSGRFREWHYQLRTGRMDRHIGTTTLAEDRVPWNTLWVPDQDRPVQVMARMVGADGVIGTTPIAEYGFERTGRSVVMHRPHDVPEYFGVNVGRRESCTFEVERDPARARSARLVLSTWSAAHASEICLNDRLLVPRTGQVHYYAYEAIRVPPDMIRRGTNTFSIYAEGEHHPAEVNWPGPVLFLEYASR